jgi:hypothetical protein
MYCFAAFGFNGLSTAGLPAARSPPEPLALDIARCPAPVSSRARVRPIEGASLICSSRIPGEPCNRKDGLWSAILPLSISMAMSLPPAFVV